MPSPPLPPLHSPTEQRIADSQIADQTHSPQLRTAKKIENSFFLVELSSAAVIWLVCDLILARRVDLVADGTGWLGWGGGGGRRSGSE